MSLLITEVQSIVSHKTVRVMFGFVLLLRLDKCLNNDDRVRDLTFRKVLS